MSLNEGPIEIIVLVEDTAHQRGLCGEHGLSFLINLPDEQILFDVGQTDLFLQNVHKLRISLNNVKTVILSHGHYDHGGGFPYLRDKIKDFTLYAHPSAFKRKYVKRGVRTVDIGLPWGEETIEQMGGKLELLEKTTPLPSGAFLTGEIERRHSADEQIVGLINEEPDPLHDDQALVLPTKQGLIVIVGCSHSGLLNTLDKAREISGEERIRAVIGGFHLLSADDRHIAWTLERVRELDVGLWGPCHCTGIRAQVSWLQAFPQRVRVLTTGSRLMFERR